MSSISPKGLLTSTNLASFAATHAWSLLVIADPQAAVDFLFTQLGGDPLLAQLLKALLTEQFQGIRLVQVTLQSLQLLVDLTATKLGHPLSPKQVLVAQGL
jgi:hypothetical protein